MPDFDVNEGYFEAGRRRADSPLSGLPADELQAAATGETRGQPAGEEERRRLPEETPVVRRTRHLAQGHFSTRGARPRRVGVTLIARRRRLARRACPYGWHVRVLGTPPRNRRRLWTMCHGWR
jgi:hypothetical protein